MKTAPNHDLTYRSCVKHCGLSTLPGTVRPFFEAYRLAGVKDRPFLRAEMMDSLQKRFAIPEDRMNPLKAAIQFVEQDETLLYFSKFLSWDMCRARWRMDDEHYDPVYPECMGELKKYYPLLLLLSCLEPSMEHLRARGVPAECYENIPDTMLRPQLEKLASCGDAAIENFQWEMNFYTCSIFLFDRFYFIPYQFFDPLTAYRSKSTGEVVALYHGGVEFRADGLLNGVNGEFQKSFTTVFEDTEDHVTGNPINPVGLVEERTVTLNRTEWEPEILPGDTFLALHIPSGPGYTPERMRSSCLEALAFYNTYFPEYHIKGFWSESWLYDPQLSLLLNRDTSNIIRCQRQMYVFPTDMGDEMTLQELFHVDQLEQYRNVPHTTGLQRAAARYIDNGSRFCVSGMFILLPEVPKIGHEPYIKAEHVERFLKMHG